MDGRPRLGPAYDDPEEARLAFWAMLEEEKTQKAIEKTQSTSLSWHLYSLYRRSGHKLPDGSITKPGLLESENYAPDSLALGRIVYGKYVLPDPIGDMPVTSIRSSHLKAWLGRLPGKPRTRIRYFSVVRAALQRLVDSEDLESNPAVGVKMPRADEPEIRILKEVAQAALLATLKEPPSPDRLAKIEEAKARRTPANKQPGRVLTPATRQRTYEAIVIALHGPRGAEVCGLRHEMFDPIHRGVWIRRQKKRDGSVRETTKGRRARWVPLDEEACAIMERKETGWVFPVLSRTRGKKEPTVNALNPRQLEKDLDAQLAFTVFEGLDLHDMRHSAVRSYKSAEDPRAAADIMGHSVATMIGVYDRSDEEDRAAALKRKKRANHPSNHPTE